MAEATAARLAKAELRRQFRRRRRALSPVEQRKAGERIATLLDRSGLLWRTAGSGYLAAYAAQRSTGELATWPLLQRCWQRQAAVALPAVTRRSGPGQLRWFAVHAASDLHRGTYNIAEPKDALAAVHPLAIAVLCVPLVAFDKAGFRLGQGGGYYDRLLGRWRHPLVLGLAHDCQFSPEPLPREPWDQPLDAVLTPSGLHSFSARGDRLAADS